MKKRKYSRTRRRKFSLSDQASYHRGWVEGFDDPRFRFKIRDLQHELKLRSSMPSSYSTSEHMSKLRGTIAGMSAQMEVDNAKRGWKKS